MRTGKISLSRLIVLLGLISLLHLSGCGGGFRSDSPNAVEIEDPVFGEDSL